MKRMVIPAVVMVLCLLCACGNAAGSAEPSGAPSVPPDVESIIEPLAEAQSEALPEESEPESEPPGAAPETQVSEAPAPESAAPTPVAPPAAGLPQSAAGALQPPKQPEPEVEAEAESAAELLRSVLPEQRLDPEKIELELLRLINSERQTAGVETLGMEESMHFAARIRAGEILSSFSHTRPNAEPYNTAFDEAGFEYAGKWHGENLSSLSFTSGSFDEKTVASEMFMALKSSPGHYRNMVSPEFLQAGIGTEVTYKNGLAHVVSSQLFSSL